MKPLNITIIQADLKWEDKEANLKMFEEKIFSSADRMELVILPEMFSTGFSMQPERLAERMDGPTISWMKRIATTRKIILTGSLIIEENGHYFNRLIWMLPTGEMGLYDKRHLFGYAGEDQHYTAGSKRLITSVKGWRINMQVCYDLRFPVWARQSVPMRATENGFVKEENIEPEYDMLVYVANWPEKRKTAWKTLLQARAIENQSFVAGVNRVGTDGNGLYHSGDSMIVDPMGEIIYSVSDREDVHTVGIEPDTLLTVRRKLPFLKDADPFMIGL